MISSFPQAHAVLLSVASVWVIISGAVLLARHPRLTGVRLHFVYCGTLAAWWIPMAFVATAGADSEATFWSRLAHLGIGLLPGAGYHLNVALAGLSDRFETRIRIHWAVSGALTLFGLFFPDLLASPTEYAWGLYPRYTLWGLLYVAHSVTIVLGILEAYWVRLRTEDPRSAQHLKARVYFSGICFTFLATIDYLPAFGVGIYPLGWVALAGVEVWALGASVRYSLVEFTPEFAAEHVFNEMPDGVVIIDRHGVVQLANGSAATFFDLPPESVATIRVDQLGGPTEVADLLRAPDPEGPPREVHVRTAPHSERYLRLSASTVKDQWRHHRPGQRQGRWLLRVSGRDEGRLRQQDAGAPKTRRERHPRCPCRTAHASRVDQHRDGTRESRGREALGAPTRDHSGKGVRAELRGTPTYKLRRLHRRGTWEPGPRQCPHRDRRQGGGSAVRAGRAAS